LLFLFVVSIVGCFMHSIASIGLFRFQARALSIGSDAYLNTRSKQIASFALRYTLPTITDYREAVGAGLLMSYGPNQSDIFQQSGFYVGRILNGEKPTDLPVLQPTKFELVINLKTAKALGLKVPDQLLALADEVIE
jgi:putative tryptophan/tyrosine transport system substrate-binding protein